MTRAVLVQAADGPGAITVGIRQVRQPREGEVLLRVRAAAVNPADVALWRTLGGGDVPVPFTPGMDAAGEVESVGPGVSHLAVGQRAMAVVFPRRPEGGAQAERIVVPAASAVGVPDGLDLVAAATVPMTGLTALEALRTLSLAPGATIAVTGGAGLLASYVIPLAVRAGLRVIADAKPEDMDLVASFGADSVVPRGGAFVDAVRRVVPSGVDGVIDTASITAAVLPAVRDGGVVVYVRTWDAAAPERGIETRRVSVGNALQNTAWLDRLALAASEGELPLRVGETYAPEAAQEAYERMASGGLRGRGVIVFP